MLQWRIEKLFKNQFYLMTTSPIQYLEGHDKWINIVDLYSIYEIKLIKDKYRQLSPQDLAYNIYYALY